ncbi:MAG: chemotaxis protein CheB [Burkholderiales bacterium]|jgi:two-component system CheB/CheR fusion protein
MLSERENVVRLVQAAGTTHEMPSGDWPDISIVAIGASAGGLEALDRFFSSLPPCPNTAFVVIQHLSPDHKSMMGDILSRHTTMPVHVAEQEMHVLPGHAYVIPPGMTMTLVGSERIRLTPKPARGLSLPIDDFFISLATELQDRAIGIVLSGTGSDGSRGILVLSDAGAWVFAQDPDTAKFDGMPRSAIATGVVDKVLSPEGLAAAVAACVMSATDRKSQSPTTIQEADNVDALSMLLGQLASTLTIDFQEYKNNTIMRRIERRMNACGCNTFKDYLDYTKRVPSEIFRLRKELLIPVSAFLRDPDSFEALKALVLIPLIHRHALPKAPPIRVWVTATAKGEEAYTVAMLIDATMREIGVLVDFKVFATDVEASYVEAAAEGRFAVDAVAALPLQWVERYFNYSPDGTAVHIASNLRQKIVFACHNLLSDPPLTNMDLVSCRNMLIYLRPTAQTRVLQRLAYSLKVGGCLFLGSSESLLDEGVHFSIVDSRHKLFQLADRSMGFPVSSVSRALSTPRMRSGRHGRGFGSEAGNQTSVVDAATSELIARYSPASLLVAASRELVHVYGQGQEYLQFQDGRASLDIIDLLPKAVGAVAAALIASVFRDNRPQRSSAVEMEVGGRGVRVFLSVFPVDQQGKTEHVLLCFEPDLSVTGAASVLTPSEIDQITLRRIADLENELALTRASLQESIGELGAANEELQATNEEMVAANEELHSTNEELQSVNEELHTVNAEFQSKIQMLDGVNADLESFIGAIRIPTLIVDEQLCLQRFTPQATLLFRLRDVDMGRPIDELNHRLNYPEIYDDLRRAIQDGQASSKRVTTQNGQHYLADVQPYTIRSDKQRRAVVTFIDVTKLHDARRLQLVLDALPANVAVLDHLGEIQLVNAAWRNFALGNGATDMGSTGIGIDYLEICRHSALTEPYAQQAFDGVSAVLKRSIPSFELCYPCHSPDERRWFLMHVTPLDFDEGGCVISHLNITALLDPARKT